MLLLLFCLRIHFLLPTHRVLGLKVCATLPGYRILLNHPGIETDSSKDAESLVLTYDPKALRDLCVVRAERSEEGDEEARHRESSLSFL